jgi:hypothetical protein
MSLCTGALWIAVFGEGVHRYAAGEVSSFTSDHGLSSQLIRAMVQDRDGSLLVGHEKGLDRLSNGAGVARITVRDAGTGISPAVLETVMEPFCVDQGAGARHGPGDQPQHYIRSHPSHLHNLILKPLYSIV